MSMYPQGHTNPGIEAVIYCLEKWFLAMEEGVVGEWMPDPTYKRISGKDGWTEDELDYLMRCLDWEFDQEVNRAPGTSTGSKLPPGFVRLGVAQRLALAQELDFLLDKWSGSIAEEMHTVGEANWDSYLPKRDYESPPPRAN